MGPLIPARVIERKRSGEVLSAGELKAFLLGYLGNEVQEPQMAAFLMAVYFRGLSEEELDTLVEVMLHSGSVLDPSGLPGPTVDKHSTGGVGDKASLPLAPLAAELGLVVPMISGRGLGHTGGTLDKLEAIPGFRIALGPTELLDVLARVGCAMVGQSEQIAPLDRRLYALRDVTATVPSIPLIAASIMSKKLAEGLDGLVLDVKVGDGAFIPEEDRALELARTLVGIGARRGLHTRALLTAMDRPLGAAVGNALEVAESIECLQGAGPADLRELVVELAAEMMLAAGSEPEVSTARETARQTLSSGRCLERFRRMVEAQGGDPSVVDQPSRLPSAPLRTEVRAQRSGFVRAVEPRPLGHAVIEMGGGRRRLGDAIDPAVGFVLNVRPGRSVSRGEPLGTVHARNDEGLQIGKAALEGAIRIVDSLEQVAPPRPLISHRVLNDRVDALVRI